MARSKNSKPKVRRLTVALTLMVISVAIVALVSYFIVTYKENGIGIFRSEINDVTNRFETIEQRYSTLLLEILTNRTAVPDFTIEMLLESYSSLTGDLLSVEQTLQDPSTLNSLSNIVAQRQASLLVLRSLNNTLRTEEIVGGSLASYGSCRKQISYTNKAATVATQLGLCKLELDNAITASIELPPESISNCPTQRTPTYYLQKTLKSHTLFTEYFALSSKSRAKEAAAKDLEYQKVLKEIQSLPAWNYCITTYLQEKAAVLLGE